MIVSNGIAGKKWIFIAQEGAGSQKIRWLGQRIRSCQSIKDFVRHTQMKNPSRLPARYATVTQFFQALTNRISALTRLFSSSPGKWDKYVHEIISAKIRKN
jgi:hypothetical protein